MSAFRCGTVGIAGRPNVGKSSLINRLVGQKLSIVSPKAQTTRHLITAILTTGEAQLVFVDAPGRPPHARSALQRMLGRRAVEAARDCDVALLVVEAMRLEAGDQAALDAIPRQQKTVVAVNKVDRVRRADRLLPFIDRPKPGQPPSRVFTWIGVGIIGFILVMTYLGYTADPTV